MIASNVSRYYWLPKFATHYIITVGGLFGLRKHSLSKAETRLTRSSLDETQLDDKFQSFRNGKGFLSQFDYKPNQTRRLQFILFGAINDSTLLAKTFGHQPDFNVGSTIPYWTYRCNATAWENEISFQLQYACQFVWIHFQKNFRLGALMRA